MRNGIARKGLRVRVLLLCALLLLALLSSYIYIGVSSGHKCTRSDCDVCEHLMFLSLLLRGAVLLSGAVSVFSRIADHSTKGFQGVSGWVCSRTPVACKVRLNN